MNAKGRKQIWVSAKVVEFLQQHMIPLSGISASDVLERALGIPRDNEKDFRYFWLVKSDQHGQTLAVDSPHKALQFAQGVKGVQVIPVREIRT